MRELMVKYCFCSEIKSNQVQISITGRVIGVLFRNAITFLIKQKNPLLNISSLFIIYDFPFISYLLFWLMGNQMIGNYEVVQKLGKGTYGKTRLIQTTDKFHYTIKILEILPGGNIENVIKQYKMHLDFSHNSFAKTRDIIIISDLKFGVMRQFFQEGNLNNHLSNTNQMLKIGLMKRLAEALLYLHNSKKICHGDLKPENIFFQENKVLLSDLAVPSFCKQFKMRKTVGGLDYKAPELVDGINNPFSVDIWSLGIIFLELNFGKKIRALQNLSNDIVDFDSNLYPSDKVIDSIQAQPFKNLIRQMMLRNPQQRPSIAQVLAMLDNLNVKNQLTQIRKIALNQRQDSSNSKISRSFEFSFDRTTQSISHYFIQGSSVERRDEDKKRYQLISHQSIPSGKWSVSVKVASYGEAHEQIGIGFITEQRKNERTSGDIGQEFSHALWSNPVTQKSHLCEDGILNKNEFAYIKAGVGILNIMVDTNEGQIEWFIDQQSLSVTKIPRSYYDKKLYVMVTLLGYGSKVIFERNGSF